MSEETLRQEIRDWLAVNYTDAERRSTEGSEIRKAWYAKLADKGWIAPHWPKQYGGADFNFQEHIALQQEFTSAGVIALPGFSGQGLNMIGPTLLEYGTDDQKARHLPGIARGEVQWCQGYSEPGSGSDLASLSTRAVLDLSLIHI